MPFRDALEKLAAKVGGRSSGDEAPPVPYASKPPASSSQQHNAGPQTYPGQQQLSSQGRKAYWEPDFHPGTPIKIHFNHELGQTGWGNNEAQNYTNSSQNSFFTPRGQLIIRAIANSTALTQEQKYTSARLTSHQLLARQEGCLTVRLTAPNARGIWPAFWLLPSDPFKWPEDGEIDIFEAWNQDPTNHSCLHWGHFTPQDAKKHRVLETPIHDLTRPDGKDFAFAWQQPQNGKGGKLVWYIDGQPVMKAEVPKGTRKMEEYRIIINIAMGGDVCNKYIPADGSYDFVIHSIKMTELPAEFLKDYKAAEEGHTM